MRFFYQKQKIQTVITATRSLTICRTTNHLLAEHSLHEKSDTWLLATDASSSVLVAQTVDCVEPHAYSAFGHATTLPSANTTSGFNGEHIQAITNNYALGSGYRIYSPFLMRFTSADSLSPFADGGINTYCYCSGDPINHVDPSGHVTVRMLISRRALLPRSKLLLSLDSPAQVNTNYNRNAPPYFSSSPDAFSTAGTPPTYNLGKLPSYSEKLPKGHRRIVTPSTSPDRKPLPTLPKYSELDNLTPGQTQRQTRSALPAEQVAAYTERLQELAGQYKRVSAISRRLERSHMLVPTSQRETLDALRNERNFIRDLLNS